MISGLGVTKWMVCLCVATLLYSMYFYEGKFSPVASNLTNKFPPVYYIVDAATFSVRPQLSAELSPRLIIRHRNAFRPYLKVLQTDLYLIYKKICRGRHYENQRRRYNDSKARWSGLYYCPRPSVIGLSYDNNYRPNRAFLSVDSYPFKIATPSQHY